MSPTRMHRFPIFTLAALWCTCVATAVAGPQSSAASAAAAPAQQSAAPASGDASKTSGATSKSTPAPPPAAAQKKPPAHLKMQTIPVTANFTPEEKEDDELSTHTAYAFGKQDDTNCQKIIDTYRTDLLPAAENAKFPKNKAKYLFIAHQSMGECQMKQGATTKPSSRIATRWRKRTCGPGKKTLRMLR